MLWKVLCATSLLIVSVSSRSIAVKGNLKCGKYPAGQILLRLWDSSRVEGTKDKLMDQTHSDNDGNFDLVAHGTLRNGWQPVMTIHHDCDDAKNPGRRMLKFRLPLSYIEDADPPKKWFDLGVFNLETHINDSEERVEQITRRRRRRHRHRAHRSAARHRTTPEPLDTFDSPEDRIEPW
ncbi:unnamed protein product [Haemonchus placei]|uniref:Transthyretin-like family protein n=1 Tax=Haemonchus placei TaxID=6290 RepID=A0A0N4WMF6_HAEPC|nr:unnamed protein product [Haemonchus placei]